MMNSKRNMHAVPKRIVWIADNDLSKTLHAATWLETTRTLRRLGWEVHLLTISDSHQGPISLRGVEMLTIKIPPIFFIKQILYHLLIFIWYVRNCNEGGIILFHEISGIWCRLFQIYRRFSGSRRDIFVIDTRTLPMEPENRQSLRTKIRRGYLKYIYNHVDRWFDGHTVITQAMAESLAIPVDKLWAVWQSGVDPALFEKAVISRQFPQDDMPIVMIYIGTMHVERNLLTFCKALVAENEKSLKFKLFLVGDGGQFNMLYTFAQQHPESIEINRPVPQEEVYQWMAKAHIGILPFPDEEKFRVSSPIKLFEYMAAGLPILATRIRCHTDVIRNENMVFWVDGSESAHFRESFKEISANRHYLSAMGQISSTLASHYTWEASAAQLSDGLMRHLATRVGIMK